MTSKDPQKLYWKQTKKLSILVACIIAGILTLIITTSIFTKASIFGFPLYFYFAAQGIIIIFIGIAFWFINEQNQLDRTHKMGEDI